MIGNAHATADANEGAGERAGGHPLQQRCKVCLTVTVGMGRERRRLRPRRAPFALAAAVLVPAALSGCGSSAPPPAPSSLGETCSQIAAVLSDGPDPGVDPVGYAQAQVIPLRGVHTADHALQQAIDRLAGAYRTFFVDDGRGAGAKHGLSVASAAIDAICPGASS